MEKVLNEGIILDKARYYDRGSKMTSDEIKKTQLRILQDVASFCKREKIIYYLAFGTLIGALRHKGFIPWDDDIDIMMPRADYDRFIKTYRPVAKDNNFFVSDGRNQRIKTIYAKVYDTTTLKVEEGYDYSKHDPTGVDIDVFPIDGLPKSNILYMFLIKWISLLNKLFAISVRPIQGTKQKRIIKGLITKVGQGTYCRMVYQSLRFFSYERSKKRGMRVFIFPNEDDRHDATIYEGNTEAEFEGNTYPIPIGYETYLRRLYGDWHVLPPMIERTTHHKSCCYYCCINKRKIS